MTHNPRDNDEPVSETSGRRVLNTVSVSDCMLWYAIVISGPFSSESGK